MTSAGGLVPLDEAAARPVSPARLGPGRRCAGRPARRRWPPGIPDAVTFDMGGTSTDVCLIRGGRPEPAAQRTVAGSAGPAARPRCAHHRRGRRLDRRIDPGGALVVGPASAGADPGPACYGRGGLAATVTDADLVAGRIPAVGRPARPGPSRRGGRPRRALDRAGVDRPRGHRRGRRQHGAGRCDGSRSSAAWTRAGPGSGRLRRRRARCTPAPWPTPWAWPPWSFRPEPASCPPPGCWPRPARSTWSAAGPTRGPRRAPGGRRPSWVPDGPSGPWPAGTGPSSRRLRLPLRRPEPRADRRLDRRVRGRAPAPQRLRPAGDARRGGRPAGGGPAALARGPGRPRRTREPGSGSTRARP